MSDLDQCAGIVRAGDPARFRAAMLAPMPVRGDLMVLYAFHIEVSRAPWVASEPMIAEIRLQWWADAVREIFEGGLRRHEVTTPLGELVQRHGLARSVLERMVDARRVECWDEPFDVFPFLEATSGGLMELSTDILGGFPGAEDAGFAQGAASLIKGLPALAARGRGFDTLDITSLAETALARLASARRARAKRAVLPALLTAVDAEAVLKDALRRGDAVRQTPFTQSEFRRRASVAMRHLSGRW